jgi:hypothetical protein
MPQREACDGEFHQAGDRAIDLLLHVQGLSGRQIARKLGLKHYYRKAA